MPETPFQLIKVSCLVATESHGPRRVEWLRDRILEAGVWTVPIKVERALNLVMDGHHRFEVAKALGLRFIPAELYSYDEVGLYSLRRQIEVTPEVIFANYEKGVVLPYKTAKHVFPVREARFPGIALAKLR